MHAMSHFVIMLLTCGLLLAAPESVPSALESLKAKVGSSYAWKGTTLTLRADVPPADSQWKAIESLGLKHFSLSGKGFTDEGLGRLAKNDPEGLSVDGVGLTDAGFKVFAAMSSLRVLSVSHTLGAKEGFTGAGFAQLKSCPRLEKITFGGSAAREDAFAAIGELQQLKEFASWHTQYGDPTHPYLLKLKFLESLRLGNSLKRYDGKPRQLCLTDATLATVAQLHALKSLNLMQAKLSLPALLQLKALPNLTSLRLDEIDLSEGDYVQLRLALSKVKVVGKPLTEAERTKLDDFLK